MKLLKFIRENNINKILTNTEIYHYIFLKISLSLEIVKKIKYKKQQIANEKWRKSHPEVFILMKIIGLKKMNRVKTVDIS
jgi:hypothetical protein